MRACWRLVIAMGVLIVLGVATLGGDGGAALSVSPVQAALVLDEPAGTHMQG